MRRVFPHWGRDGEILPSLDDVNKDFRKKFDRDMTDEEVRLYVLTKDLIEQGFIDRRIQQVKVKEERRNVQALRKRA